MNPLKSALHVISAAVLITACSDIPLVFDRENTAESYPAPEMPQLEELEVLETLPDPLEFEDGNAAGLRSWPSFSIMKSDSSPRHLANALLRVCPVIH